MQRVKQEIAEIKIIVISAIDVFQLVDSITEIRIDRYSIKPIDFNDLLSAIRGVVDDYTRRSLSAETYSADD
ncbi:MAG: hypothetical protein AAGU75_20520 [Bacillota bacterium]